MRGIKADREQNDGEPYMRLIFILLTVIAILLWLYGVYSTYTVFSMELESFSYTIYFIAYLLTVHKPTVFENVAVNIYHIIHYSIIDKESGKHDV